VADADPAADRDGNETPPGRKEDRTPSETAAISPDGKEERTPPGIITVPSAADPATPDTVDAEDA